MSGCIWITDSDLKPTCNLSKLEVLKIDLLLKITGSGLGRLPNLKKLHCLHCKNLQDDHLIRLLRSADKLQYLDITGCNRITNSVLNVDIEVTKSRENNVASNVALEMKIDRTGINPNEISDRSTLLYLFNKMYLSSLLSSKKRT